MSFASRLVAGTLLVLFFTISVLVWTAERALRDTLQSDTEQALVREAHLVREALPQDSVAWPAAVRRLAREVRHRIVLVDRAGTIRADSDDGGSTRLSGPGLEVRAALAGRDGTALLPAAGSAPPYLSVAVPGRPGAVVLRADLGPVDTLVRRSQGAVLGAAALALLVGSLVALVAGRSVAQPLTAISSATRAIAAGAMPRYPRSGIPDVDSVVQALRAMHRELADRFDELKRERAESAALVDAMVEGVIAADRRGRIATANPAARRLLGYPPAGPLPDLPELFRVKAARETVDGVLAGEVIVDRELELDGRTIVVNARPLAAGGAVLVLHDLTEVRRLEAVRRDFVANVSHELKTPLTAISGWAETVLGENELGGGARRPLEIILANAQRMQRLVDDLLDLSRIEAGRWQARPEPTLLAPVVQEVWTSLTDGGRGATIRFDTSIHDDAALLHADPGALRQVLVNLLDNALRYCRPGGTIAVRSTREGELARVTVRDDGAGIAREHLPRIFERFYRVDPSRSRAEGGTGLGLAIVKHLVEAHGGRVAADSQLGTGTSIHCWFPLAPAGAPAVPPTAPAPVRS